uniref:Doublecortin domain-containing protein n=1 Tax=Spermophilus dauricus TaxID=99837 RepID=A0A8C9PRD1_SPEDA
TIGEKVFPWGGVRKLFTLDGHLLENSQDLQDSQFYVAAGLENFKSFPYWRSPNVPIEVQEKYSDMERRLQKKKKVTSKEKEPPKDESVPPRTQDSVYYAKQGKKKPLADPLVQMGTEGDVYRGQKPTRDTQGAPDVKEDQDVQVEVPVDQAPAEVVKEDEESESTRDFEGIQ